MFRSIGRPAVRVLSMTASNAMRKFPSVASAPLPLPSVGRQSFIRRFSSTDKDSSPVDLAVTCIGTDAPGNAMQQ